MGGRPKAGMEPKKLAMEATRGALVGCGGRVISGTGGRVSSGMEGMNADLGGRVKEGIEGIRLGMEGMKAECGGRVSDGRGPSDRLGMEGMNAEWGGRVRLGMDGTTRGTAGGKATETDPEKTSGRGPRSKEPDTCGQQHAHDNVKVKCSAQRSIKHAHAAASTQQHSLSLPC